MTKIVLVNTVKASAVPLQFPSQSLVFTPTLCFKIPLSLSMSLCPCLCCHGLNPNLHIHGLTDSEVHSRYVHEGLGLSHCQIVKPAFKEKVNKHGRSDYRKK